MQIGARMKNNYEKPWNIYLPWRMPVIIRLDGKNFHSFTRRMKRPFDQELIDRMVNLAKHLCEEVSTTQFAYSQSDEISLLLNPYKKLDTEPFFRNELQKICSITAGMASAFFSAEYGAPVVFDARTFVLPEDEVCNYFIWRQQDATRNSISMVAQSLFSDKELFEKNNNQKQEMIFQKSGQNWNDYPTFQKRGFCVTRSVGEKWIADMDIPEFTKDRDYVNQYLEVVEE
jgi:tRNA(His) 5'-end guanylyltransferase